MDAWRLDGRTCVVTGATSGIGRAAAAVLAAHGAALLIVGRNRRRVVNLCRELRERGAAAEPRGLVADLSSLAEVRTLARDILELAPRLDVLVNSAAVVPRRRQATVDGLERQFMVNHLAPFLLTNLLLDRLVQSAPARVVTIASQMERHGTIDFDDLMSTRAYDRIRAYCQTKLANVLFTRELARRVGQLGVTPISLHPGVYSTRLLDDLMGWSHLVTTLRGRQEPSANQAAEVILRAAAAPELADAAGAHLQEHSRVEPSLRARDAELASRLWEVSAILCGLEENHSSR